ncbi:MAG: J domain-containing protein [Hyphomicrobium sp.]
MDATAAVKVAIDLVQVPSRVRRQQSLPLPHGVVTVLSIAAGDKVVLSEACEAVSRPCALVRTAAAFFIEQILLHPDADSYRILGASQNATPGELRRNMALLLRWLHPDVNKQGERSIFVTRVTQSWEDLKTPERRAMYDKTRRKKGTKSHAPKMPRTPRQFKRHAVRQRSDIWADERKGLLRRAIALLLGGTRHSRM